MVQGGGLMENTLERWEYIKEHLFWSVLVFVWFSNLIFRRIPNCTGLESLMRFLLLFVCVTGVGIAMAWQRNRNYLSLSENVIIPFGVYVCISYAELYIEYWICVGVVTVLISIALSVMILCRRIKRKRGRDAIVRKRLGNVLTMWKRNIAMASLALLCFVFFTSFLCGDVLESNASTEKVYGDEHSLSANIDVIAEIEPSKWETLDTPRKLFVSQKIINCEARYYGLSHEIVLRLGDLEGRVVGHYNDLEHQITLDEEFFETAYGYDVLETILHEVAHAYQLEQVALYQKLTEKERNLLMFYPVKIYATEFADYKNGNENYWEYYNQLVEQDARHAGGIESLEYVRSINEHLGIQVENMDEFENLQEYTDYIMN